MYEDCLEKLLEVAIPHKLEYVGNCVSILRKGGFTSIATDATQLAQVVERGKQITVEKFIELTTIEPTFLRFATPKKYSFWYNKEKKLAWYRDEDKDVEYFYL